MASISMTTDSDLTVQASTCQMRSLHALTTSHNGGVHRVMGRQVFTHPEWNYDSFSVTGACRSRTRSRATGASLLSRREALL